MRFKSVHGHGGAEAAPRRLIRWAGATALAVGVLALALPWSADQERRAEARWLAQLSATADDRLAMVEDWIASRERDAATIAGYPTASYVAGRRDGVPPPVPVGQDPRRHIEDLFRGAQRTHGYDAVWLASPAGEVIAATARGPVDAGLVTRAVSRRGPEIAFSAGRQALIAAPLPGGAPIGAIVLSIDPSRLLYPLLRRETAQTRTGACALVSREGDDLVFLSPLRDEPAGRRVPLSSGDTAAAAALGGAPRVGRFRDERGREVLAAVRPVAGRPWGLLVRIERDEALEPARRETRRTLAGAAALVAALAGSGVLLWRQQAISSRLAVARADARLARLLRALSAVNQLIAREPDRLRFLREACHLVVQEGGFLLAWIGFRDPETDWLVPSASAGDDGYLTETWMSADPRLEQGLGPTGVAVREGRTVVIRDVEAESTTAPWRTEALARGIRSIVATPVRAHGAVIGSLAVYAGQAGAFDPEATHLVERIATDVGFATEAAEARRERERAVDALARSKASLEAVVAHSPAAIVTLQPDGRIGEIWNRAAEQLFGWSRDEVIGQAPPYVPPEAAEASQALAARLHAGETIGDAELRLVRRDGAPVDVTFAASPIRDPEGRGAGVLTVMLDVTARRRAEDELRRTQEQFLQAQKLEAVGRLAGGVAHDLNNILGVIIGQGEMAAAGLAPGHPAEARLGQILAAAHRAASLTRQLLAFSRRQVLKPRVLDLNAEVTDIEKMLRRLIGEDIALETSLASGLGRVRADSGQIGQVLMNLAVNARDAMPDGGVLRIETANAEVGEDEARRSPSLRPGSYVRLRVTDDGVGMEPSVREHVFDPFFTTKAEGRGTGLGLSTVYGIVTQSGGFVRVDSEPGRGAAFTIDLPRVEAAADAALAAADAPPRGRGEAVLVVEDQAHLRELACEMLEDAGYRVLSAPDGRAALHVAAAHEGRVDLLIADVVMPGMGGPEVAHRLTEARPGLRTLLVSGYANEAAARGGNDYPLLEKPFTRAELLARVREVLDGPAGGAPR